MGRSLFIWWDSHGVGGLQLDEMNPQAYLDRINYQGKLEPTKEVLFALHWAHMHAVPFENLEISLGRKIVLDKSRLFDKIVGQRRGGFCYELNGLFAWLLREIGFEVVYLSAQVARKDGGFGLPEDHLALRVKTADSNQAYFVDVGFGRSFCQPLLLDKGGVQDDNGRLFNLIGNGLFRILWHYDKPDWKPSYLLNLQPKQFQEFANMCVYHQTSPDSTFTQGRVATIKTSSGRVTLSEEMLIETTDEGGRVETAVPDEATRTVWLKQHFGIELGK